MSRRLCAVGLSLLVAVGWVGLAGCSKPAESPNQVVIYTSVDDAVATPILNDFQKRTGIRVTIVTDAEATKSVGLAQRVEAERDNPRADVWWGNEPFYTIDLAQKGLLAPYAPPAGTQVAEQFRDPRQRWYSVGLRARVLAIVDSGPGRTPASAIKGLADLARPELKGKIAMARPTAGTTGGHVAALYVLWGEQKADAFFRDLKANEVMLLGGNAEVARKVAEGVAWAGMTDNDDVESAKGLGKVFAKVPDQGSDEMGTLVVPTTVGLVAGAKHPDAAKQLIDYLVSREVEQRLIDAQFARFSAFKDSGENLVKPMAVDYAKVAEVLPRAKARVMEILR